MRKNRIGNLEVGPYWEMYSIKAAQIVRVRGDLRYYSLIHLEANPAYKSIIVNPIRLSFRVSKRWVSASIDFVALDDAGNRQFIWTDHRYDASDTGNLTGKDLQYALLKMWASRKGVRLEAWSRNTLLADRHFIANWVHILRVLRRQVDKIDQELCSRLLSAITCEQPISFGALKAQFAGIERELFEAGVFHLLHRGSVQADLRGKNQNDDTLITLS